MARPCPICASTDTGASVKSHKNYTPDRGRLDIDYNRCHACGAAWDSHDYARGETETKDIRLGTGNLQAWGDLPAPQCTGCHSGDVRWLYEEGRWHEPGVGILRYECAVCGQIWQEMARDEDGKRVARRVWRRGRKIDKE